MTENDREILNQFIVSRFSMLHHMYKQAEKEARLERDAQLYQDWTEWAELDEESRQFVRAYLNTE